MVDFSIDWLFDWMVDCSIDWLIDRVGQVHHDNSSDFNALAGDTVLRVLQHDGLTVDEETVRAGLNKHRQLPR